MEANRRHKWVPDRCFIWGDTPSAWVVKILWERLSTRKRKFGINNKPNLMRPLSAAARFYMPFSSHSRQCAMMNLEFLEERKTSDDTFWDSNFPLDRTTYE